MSYHDPPPDPPFFAPAESEVSVQPPTSPQNHSSEPTASSCPRICSVKNCGKELPESHSGKMCDECRGRHRVYASTKRQKRKMEKMTVGLTLQSGLVAGDGAVFMPPDPGHGRSVSHTARLPPPGPIASTSTSAIDGEASGQPDPAQTPVGWDAQIDPRLYQSSSPGLAGPSPSQSSPIQDEEEETLDHAEQVPPPPGADATSSQPLRYCSIKGCRQVLPDDHSYKMCQSCRDRYREYGNVKREKWKKNKEAALALLEQARQAEEQRRKEAGLPSLAELPASERKAWEENLMPRVPPPPPAGASALPPIRMCTVSHCHVILSGDYEYRRCEQHRVQNRHHSKLKRVRDKEEKGMLPPTDRASSSSPAATGAGDMDHAGDGHDDSLGAISREDYVCQIKGCYNFLDPKTPWLICEVHRQIDRGARLQHADASIQLSANETLSTAAPSSPPTTGAIAATSSSRRPSSGQQVASPTSAVPLEGTHAPSSPTTSVVGPPVTNSEVATNSEGVHVGAPEARSVAPSADKPPTDSAASKDVHLHPKLHVPYFFHPAYVQYREFPMLVSMPSPFAPSAPDIPSSQFGPPSQFVQAGSPFVQGGPYTYPYMMPIPPPTQPSPFTNPSSAPSPFASSTYSSGPGWYGSPPPPSEAQERVDQGFQSATTTAQPAATSSSATSQHPRPATSRAEPSTFMTRPLTFKHAPGSSVFNTPSASSAPAPSEPSTSLASPTAHTLAYLPPPSSSSPPASGGTLEQRSQLSPPSSHPPQTSSLISPDMPALHHPSVHIAALASADDALSAIRHGSDTGTPPRPGVRRRSTPGIENSGSLEIIMYDPTLPNRKRRRIDEDVTTEATPGRFGPSSTTPGSYSATFTPGSSDAMPVSSVSSPPPRSTSPVPATAAASVKDHHSNASSTIDMRREAVPRSHASTTQAWTPAPGTPTTFGVPLSALGPVQPDASHQSIPIMQPQPARTPDIPPASQNVCAGAHCRRKVSTGALCRRCVGKAKHAKQVSRVRHRLEPVRIGRKVSIR